MKSVVCYALVLAFSSLILGIVQLASAQQKLIRIGLIEIIFDRRNYVPREVTVVPMVGSEGGEEVEVPVSVTINYRDLTSTSVSLLISQAMKMLVLHICMIFLSSLFADLFCIFPTHSACPFINFHLSEKSS